MTMLCTDDWFPPRTHLQHIEGVTICDYVTAYEDAIKRKVFPDLPNVPWGDKFFDITIGYDIIEKRRGEANLLGVGVSAISCAIISSLEYVLSKSDPQNRRAQEYLKRMLCKKSKTRISVLAAHGETAYAEWHYYENDIPVARVQAWIDEQSREVQGKKRPEALLLGCCNPANLVPLGRGVPVLYATGKVGFVQDYTYHLLS